MHNTERNMTAASIRYLLAVHALCVQGQGARCVDVAERLGVTKPSAHAMIESLCRMGLAQKKRYSSVYLTEEGEQAARLYASCCEPLYARLQEALGLDEECCRSAACAVLAQMSDRLPQLQQELGCTA